MHVRVATRGSRLALTQTGWLVDRHKEANPGRSDDGEGTVTVETMPEIKSQRCWLLVADIEEFTQLS